MAKLNLLACLIKNYARKIQNEVFSEFESSVRYNPSAQLTEFTHNAGKKKLCSNKWLQNDGEKMEIGLWNITIKKRHRMD